MRYHFALIMTTEMKRCQYQGLAECGTVPCWWEYKMDNQFGKQFGSLFKSLTTATICPATPLLDIWPREMKGYVYTNTWT